MSKKVQFKPVEPSDNIMFRCSLCGACCRHVKDSVLLESLDVYRIARFMKDTDSSFADISNCIERYTEVAYITAGYPVLILKTTGGDDSCIFLKDSRCTIHRAKPRACRLYPFVAGPDDSRNGMAYFLSNDRKHHFKEGYVNVGDWMLEHLSFEDRYFLNADYSFASELGQYLRRLNDSQQEKASFLNLYFHYFHYDLEQPFMEQYRQNQRQLRREMQKLVDVHE